ncbi:MAG: DUF6252 family protein [Puia sp.]|nr:DUF6252 family protein [Puia sp.]
MKVNLFLLASLGFYLMTGLLLSCRKDGVRSNPVTTVSDSSASFSATIGGVNWQTDSVTAVMGHEFPGYAKIITINGYTSGRVISISLRDTSFYTSNDSTLLTGQYIVNNHGMDAAFVYLSEKALVGRDSVWRIQGAAESGTATVTASDGIGKLISGTFNFTARVVTLDSINLGIDTLAVSNGVFKNIPYVYLR